MFRVVFWLAFNFAISKCVRKFELWSLLILFLFDGNIQQFAFYQSTDWKNTFYFTFCEKWLQVITIFFGFCIVLASFTLYFISYSAYNKVNRHIMDNNKNILFGQTALIVQFGIRNIVLGVMHSFVRGLPYRIMLSILLIS